MSRSRKPPPARQAAQRNTRWYTALIEAHANVARDCLKQLLNTPLSSLMTVFVIAIALLLPTLVGVFRGNLTVVDQGLTQSAQITLYLLDDITEDEGLQVSNNLLTKPQVSSAQYISPAQALVDFANYSGFGELLHELADNPLPASITVVPADSSVASTRLLFDELRSMPEVEFAQIDLEWLQRLAALRNLLGRISLVASTVLGLAVLFIVGNTIRLSIENRKTEIEVIKLVGGTDSFVARPFLYTGLFLGLAGGLLACVLVSLMLASVSGALQTLLELYGSEFQLQSFHFSTALGTILLGAGLGWTGALVCTIQQLLRLREPW